MAIKNRTQLKAYFETFDKPTETEFADLIDSMYIKGTDSFTAEASVPFKGDQNLVPSVTVGDNQSTGITLSQAPISDTRVDVYINGENIPVGDGVKTSYCYFSRDSGTTALPFNDLQVGDELYYNGLISHIGDLDANDRIDLNYHYLKPIGLNISDPITSIPLQSNMLVVDAVNGDDATAQKGSFVKRYSTIAGAEIAAVSGDVLIIVSDIQESALGKDGLTYVFWPGVRLFWPLTPGAAGVDLPESNLWTDKGKGTISFTVIGGKHEIDSDWYDPDWDRAIIRLDNGSTVYMHDIESCSNIGDDGYTWYIDGGSKFYCEVFGDLVTHSGVWTGASNNEISINIHGNVTCTGKWINTGQGDGGAGSNNTISVIVDGIFNYIGHPIWGVRTVLYPGYGNAAERKDQIYFRAHEIWWNDQDEAVGSTTGAFIFPWGGVVNSVMTIEAELLVMTHANRATATNPTQALIRAAKVSGGYMEVNFNVRKIVLDKLHPLSIAPTTGDRANTIIKWNNCDIINTDETRTTVFFNTDYENHVFQGTNRIVIHPDAITAGAKALGSTTDSLNNAILCGPVITNGDVEVTTTPAFTDSLTGSTSPANLFTTNATIVWSQYDKLI